MRRNMSFRIRPGDAKTAGLEEEESLRPKTKTPRGLDAGKSSDWEPWTPLPALSMQ